ncbi:MAG: TIGR00645 family protein [Ferrovibrio sp.]|nr:TIGR00645 family protein [Ferrovibrio sp.]MCW0234422.1 TIGR00645 family protein [Ferrovibrio sp.]
MLFLERLIERTLFASRWVMAPFYLGLAVALVLLLVKFLQELFHTVPVVFSMSESQLVLSILSLIDLSLAGNLLLLVIFSGYENFVSKIDNADHKDRPEWMGKIDYSGMKLKLVASIVAISAIQLLRAFMNIGERDNIELAWLVGIHLTFVVSGVLLALMDRLIESAEGHGKDPHIPNDTEVRDGTVIDHDQDGSKSGGKKS